MMNKGITILKKTFKAILWIVIILLLLLIITGFLLKIPAIQSGVAEKLSGFLSRKISATAEIEKIKISFLSSITVEGLYFSDKENDTLLYAGEVMVNISVPDLLKKELHVTAFSLSELNANVYRQSSDSLFNYNFILSAFSDTAKKEVKELENKSGWTIRIDQVRLRDLKVKYIDDYGGMNASAELKTLHLNMKETDIHQSVFDIDSLLADGFNADILIKSSKGKKAEQTKGKLPVITAKRLILKDINLNFRDSLQEINAGIFNFRLMDALADLNEDSIKIGEIRLAQSGIKLINNAPEDLSDTITEKAKEKSDWNISVKKIDLVNNSVELRKSSRKEIKNAFDVNYLVL